MVSVPISVPSAFRQGVGQTAPAIVAVAFCSFLFCSHREIRISGLLPSSFASLQKKVESGFTEIITFIDDHPVVLAD